MKSTSLRSAPSLIAPSRDRGGNPDRPTPSRRRALLAPPPPTPLARIGGFALGALVALGALAGAPTATAATAAAAPLPGEDWPLWGGDASRNMVSYETGLPTEFSMSRKKQRNVKWTAKLGSQTFGNPVVAGGKVLVGTNNGNPRDLEIEGDRGVLMCFDAKDGSFLWQAVHAKLETGDSEDWSEIGICSTPHVVDDRVYYVNNRCELVALDLEGFRDGENDGPTKDEAKKGETNADVIWTLDMRKLGVSPFQASASSPLVVGDLVFTVTGQGVDDREHVVKNPEAPSFLAVDRHTGEIAWKDASPGADVIEGQWGSPAYGVVDAVAQVAFPGGDGWLYSFEPKTGKLLWKFDCKAHERGEDGTPKTANYLVGTPVFYGHRVIVANGQNPEAGGGPGCLRAIDARKRGDITKTAELWRIDGRDFGVSIGTVAVHDGLVYATELDGFVSCVDLETGKRVWRHDMLAYVWGSPYVADGKVYVRNEDGDCLVLKAGRDLEELALNTLPGLIHGTVVAADGVLYCAGSDTLFALAKGAGNQAAADAEKASGDAGSDERD